MALTRNVADDFEAVVRRTLATLRSPRLLLRRRGVAARANAARFCETAASAGTFLRDILSTRGIAISWWIVGMSDLTLSRAKRKADFANSFGTLGPIPASRGTNRAKAKFAPKDIMLRESRLRRHRETAFITQQSEPLSLVPRVMPRSLSRNCPRKTKTVLSSA